ncbi:uncharacterized protein E6C27_scaffold79G001940 [Cucumis melo var. makuwa]|uniref:Uncharacterized protein n=1 Tax=Cucumis melo var. makuwa TaxID=1194695 RepID=A0A5A7V5Z6_CUCMM|nr:uncharacterized protein E6C27_scaffold79G001940 [Cucumis melo var. makuwa]
MSPDDRKTYDQYGAKGRNLRDTEFYTRTRKLSPRHSRSHFLGTSTESPRALPVSFAASAFSVVSDTGRAFTSRWKHWPSFGPFWVAPQFSLQRARFPTYTFGKHVREHASTGFSSKPGGFLVFSYALSILNVHESNQILYLVSCRVFVSEDFYVYFINFGYVLRKLWVLEVRTLNLENLEIPRGNRPSLQTGKLDKTVIFPLSMLSVLRDNDVVVEIELPVPDTHPTSTESSGSNSSTWLELYIESVHVEMFCYYTNQVMSGLYLMDVGKVFVVSSVWCSMLNILYLRLKVLELSSFLSLQVHFQCFLTPNECSPLVRSIGHLLDRFGLRHSSPSNELASRPIPLENVSGSMPGVWVQVLGARAPKIERLITNTEQSEETVRGLLFTPGRENWVRGILAPVFLGRAPKVLELSPFPSLQVHFQWFLTPDERSLLVGSIGHLLIVLGRAIVLPLTSSLPDLYLRKTCQGAWQECGLKSSEHEPQ